MKATTSTHRERTEAEHTVLMTGAGAPGASGIVRSLRSNDDLDVRIVGVDMNEDVYGFSLVDAYDTIPAGGDGDYIPEMVDVAEREQADVILPLTTAELRPLSANRDAFDATVMVSDPGPLHNANDKGALYEFLDENGFASTPEFRRVDSESTFVDAVESLGYPDEPVCFKPPVASGMRGFRILDERFDRLTRLLEKKPDEAVTTLSEIRPVLASADTFPELVVMEYLPGEEYSVDVLAMENDVRPVVPRTRSRTRAGITFQGVVEKRADLIEEAAAITRGIGLEYNVNLQFKHDGNGRPKLIEINPRVSGTIIMSVGAGANLPALAVGYALGQTPPQVDVQWGTRMSRYWQEVFHAPDGRTFFVDDERTSPPNTTS
ncbi:MAG: ATP-grasp domain-containing protein [Halodesulfurarchaeum sp.]